jgi:AraC-like DNA-binding protein
MSVIAAEAAFSDMSCFYAAFRRHFGPSPSDVRVQARRAH